MFDISKLFISTAHAAAEAVPEAVLPAPTVSSELMRFLPLFLIFMVFYFLLIRPQQKKLDEQTKMLNALKKGDKIVLGGLLGTIAKIEGDDIVVVELAKDVHVRGLRSAVSALQKDGKQVANSNEEK
ncbi:MAG: preprotein translocase subunit YajC [Bdellovibrionales bacterium]